MRWYLLFITLFLLLVACSPDPICRSPFIMIDDVCCRDDNNNNRCDMEEQAEVVTEEPEEPEPQDSESQEPQTLEPQETTQEPEMEEQETEPEMPETQSAKPTQADAVKVVNLFASSWQSKQYNIQYSYFTDKLKKIKTQAEFVAIMELNPSEKKVSEVNVKNVQFKSDTEGIVTLEIWTNVKSYETQDTKVLFQDGEWKMDGMIEVFYVDTFGAACGYTKEFNKQACAKDLAVKLKDTKYCERSKCHYTDCMMEIKGSMTKKERVFACNLCPPVMKSTKECIVDVAIELDDISVCNEIPESSYADRYCKCYGGFARSKGSSAHCNLISNSDYKDLCLKGFEGKYC